MPQPSVFDPPQGVLKADGQYHQTGVGNQMPAGTQMMPQASAPATAAQPGLGGAIQTLIAALASAFAPKSITQAPQREAAQEAQAQGLGDSLK
jgi:hypothetical protein